MYVKPHGPWGNTSKIIYNEEKGEKQKGMVLGWTAGGHVGSDIYVM